MDIYVKKSTREVGLSAVFDFDSSPQIGFKQSVDEPLVVQFVDDLGVVLELDDASTGEFGLKVPGSYDGEFIVSAGSWVKSGTGTTAAYTFTPSLSTTELAALLDPVGGISLPFVRLIAEVRWIELGIPYATWTIPATVYNNVIKGTEGQTTANPPRTVTALSGILPLDVGVISYTLDVTALGFSVPPRGMIFNFIAPTGGMSSFGAHLVADDATPTSINIETDAEPMDEGTSLAYLIIP